MEEKSIVSEERLALLVEEASNLREIEVLYLFGSYAKGVPNRLSDIDLAVLLSEEVKRIEYFGLRRQLIAKFASILCTDAVDLIVLNEAPLHLSFEAIAPRAILYEKNPSSRVKFETRIVNEFLDFRPFLEVRASYVKRQLSQGIFFG